MHFATTSFALFCHQNLYKFRPFSFFFFTFVLLQVRSWLWWLLVCPRARAQTWCGRGFAGSCWKTFPSDGWRACSLGWCRLLVGETVADSENLGKSFYFIQLSVFNGARLLCFCFFRPDALGRIIGNLVLTNKKAQFVITHKLLLLQYKYEVLQ